MIPSGLACLASALAPALADGRSIQLSTPHELLASADVHSAALSPDSAWIVYVANDPETDARNVYSVPSDGLGSIRILSDNAVPTAVVRGVTISPDSTRVLYMVGVGAYTLFSVPIDGSSAPVDLLGPHVTDFQVTPDSARVVLRGDPFTANRFLLWSVPIAGGALLEESGPFVAGGDVDRFVLTPDGTRAVYRGDANHNGTYELFSAPVGSVGGAVRLNSQLPAGGQVSSAFEPTGDGTRVAYLATEVTNDVQQLFSVPVDGSASRVRLNAPLPPGRDVLDFALSADGALAIYRASSAIGRVHLFGVRVDGSAAARLLSTGMPGFADVGSGMRVSPDGTRAVYLADALVSGVQDLFSVPIDASSAPVPLNAPLAAGEFVSTDFAFKPIDGRVVFVAGTNQSNALFVAPLDGSTAPLALDSAPSTSKSAPKVTPNGVRVLYLETHESVTQLRSARLDGAGVPVALSAGRAVGVYEPVASGAGVLYTSDDQDVTVLELFVRATNGSGGALQINPEFPKDDPFGTVGSCRVAGARVLYTAGRSWPIYSVALYSVPIFGGETPICISGGVSPPIEVDWESSLEVGAGGSRAVFVGMRTAARELFSAPVGGGAPPATLNGSMTSGGSIASFLVSSDGSSVVYLADQDADDVFELYRAAIDGSLGPTKLNASLVAGGDVLAGYRASAEGARVIYVADQDVDQVFELYSADGGGAPVKLSGTLTAGGDVEADPWLSPDGAWVYYRADASVDGRVELFRVASDGSASPVALSGSIVSGGGARELFRVTPDGARVVFRADREVAQRIDLYVAPTDASAPPLKLNSGGGASSDIEEIALDPTGTRVVFVYDLLLQDVQLFSVRIDGSSPQALISPITATGGRVQELDEGCISPDGARVVYRANAEDFDRIELYSGHIDGAAAPVKLNHPFESGWDVTSFRISPDGNSVAFVAPAGLNSLSDIFCVPITRSRPPVRLNPPYSGARAGARSDYEFSPGSTALVHRFDTLEYGAHDLYSALLTRDRRGTLTPR